MKRLLIALGQIIACIIGTGFGLALLFVLGFVALHVLAEAISLIGVAIP